MHINGRHITAMVVAISAAAVLAPVSVGAATGSFVNIRDPFSSATSGQARVTSGALAVSEERNSVTRSGIIENNGNDRVVLTIPANKTLRIGTIAVSHFQGGDDVFVQVAQVKPTTNCLGVGVHMGYSAMIRLSPGELKSPNYTPRLTLPAQSYPTCLAVYLSGGGGGNYVHATVTGSLS